MIECDFVFSGIFVAMIPFLTEPPESIDFVDLAVQFLSQTRPKQIAIYHQALELKVLRNQP